MVEPQPTPTISADAVFQQFRARYPTGSLNSELVRVQAQTFVVRVHLQLEEQGSVTALAADPILEVAEDRARQRAFHLLGLSAPAIPTSPPPDPKAISTKAVEPPKPQTKPAITAPSPPTATVETDADVPPEAAELTPPLDLMADPGLPPAASTAPPPPLAQSQAAISKATVVTSKPQGPAITETLPAPIDLSDVIAQTDVELKRLAWSVQDGRDYLEQTYGKRSRHDLTDEELLAFLLHLESLPTPATP